MKGSVLKEILDEKGISVSELARRLSVSPQTLYSIIKRDNLKVDFDLMIRICRELSVPVERFTEEKSSPAEALSTAEWELIRKFRRLDAHGKRLVRLVMSDQRERIDAEKAPELPKQKIIPLYYTPAAAGYASPAIGDDYEELSVSIDSSADFAVRIDGDSMDPYIKNGSVAYVKRGATIYDGDVGLFYVDGDMKCKQYCRDVAGNVYLFSANRSRADADVFIPPSSGITLLCFGKVLLEKRIPLP